MSVCSFFCIHKVCWTWDYDGTNVHPDRLFKWQQTPALHSCTVPLILYYSWTYLVQHMMVCLTNKSLLPICELYWCFSDVFWNLCHVGLETVTTLPVVCQIGEWVVTAAHTCQGSVPCFTEELMFLPKYSSNIVLNQVVFSESPAHVLIGNKQHNIWGNNWKSINKTRKKRRPQEVVYPVHQ